MEFLCTAAYLSSATDHLTLISSLRARKYHAIWKNLRGKWPFNHPALFSRCACLKGCQNLVEQQVFLRSLASIRLDKHDIHTQLMRKRTFHVAWLPVLYRFPTLYFHSNSIVFISTVGFSNEDNCCQSEGIGKSIKKTLLKGILRVDWLINVAANTTSFFYESAFSEVFFQNHAWNLGVRFIHQCGL